MASALLLARRAAAVLPAPSATLVVRCASTQALVQPPVRLPGLDGRYATALFSAASKAKALDKVENDFKALSKLLASDRGVRDFFNTPVLNVKQKKTGIDTIAKKGSYQPTTVQFLNVLAENGRLNQAQKITTAFAQLMAAHRGEVEAVITTAKDIDAKTKSQLEAAIKKNFVSGSQKLSVTAKVDPGILGGVVVQVGEKTIDLSVATKLNKINTLLADNL